MAFATVPIGDFLFTQGEELVGQVASSDFGHRRFCTRCGTPFLMQGNHQPETVDFSIATLDAPEGVVPGFHIFYGEHLPWAPAGDNAPRHEKSRPKTRGL